MDFSFNGSPRMAARPTERREAPRPGTIDLSFAPASGGSNSLQIHAEADGKEVGPDWLNRVAAWWARHGYYPDEAAKLGQHGDVTVSMTVAHSGHVDTAGVTRASNSPWLNLGALSVFQNANLPPLPPDITASDIDLTFTIHYIIVP
jgi:periplasmic protein TonB